MSRELADRCAGRRIPQLNHLIVAAGCQKLRVGRESNRIQTVLVPSKRELHAAACGIPDRDFAEQPRFASRRGQPFAIGREGDGHHVTVRDFELSPSAAAGGVYQANLPVRADRHRLAVGRVGDRLNRQPPRHARRDFWNDEFRGIGGRAGRALAPALIQAAITRPRPPWELRYPQAA